LADGVVGRVRVMPTGVPDQGICDAHLVSLHCVLQWVRPAPLAVELPGASGLVVHVGGMYHHFD
jgi:hypothetical protein